jgi:hypothetical protein
MSGAGLFAPLQRPEMFRAAVLDFLREDFRAS